MAICQDKGKQISITIIISYRIIQSDETHDEIGSIVWLINIMDFNFWPFKFCLLSSYVWRDLNVIFNKILYWVLYCYNNNSLQLTYPKNCIS